MNNHHNGGRRALPGSLKVVTAGGMAAVVAACTVKPDPMTSKEHAERVKADRKALFGDVAPVDDPIGPYEAMARAIKYNLDHRLKLMKKALANRKLEVASFKMLPELTAEAGYSGRNKHDVTSSQNIFTGQETDADQTSSDRDTVTADMTLTWNILDFGVSYYGARQEANRALTMQEQRRKTIHNLMKEVRSAYWKAAGAARVKDQVARILAEAEKALAQVRQAKAERLRNPVQALRLEKALIETMRQMEGILSDLEQAKPRLASLMGLPPGRDFALDVPEQAADGLDVPTIDRPISELERLSLHYRPELREAAYKSRNSRLETRKALLRMLPGIELTAAGKYDSNSFALHNHWFETGAQVSWNLFNLIQGPARMDRAEAEKKVARTKRLAVSMAVLTQVNVAYEQFTTLKQDFRRARRLRDIERTIQEHVTNARQTEAKSRVDMVKTMASATRARLDMYRTYGKLQNAAGRIYASMGLDPLPDTMKSHDLEAVTRQVRKAVNNWEEGDFSWNVAEKRDTGDNKPEAATQPEQDGSPETTGGGTG